MWCSRTSPLDLSVLLFGRTRTSLKSSLTSESKRGMAARVHDGREKALVDSTEATNHLLLEFLVKVVSTTWQGCVLFGIFHQLNMEDVSWPFCVTDMHDARLILMYL